MGALGEDRIMVVQNLALRRDLKADLISGQNGRSESEPAFFAVLFRRNHYEFSFRFLLVLRIPATSSGMTFCVVFRPASAGQLGHTGVSVKAYECKPCAKFWPTFKPARLVPFHAGAHTGINPVGALGEDRIMVVWNLALCRDKPGGGAGYASAKSFYGSKICDVFCSEAWGSMPVLVLCNFSRHSIRDDDFWGNPTSSRRMMPRIHHRPPPCPEHLSARALSRPSHRGTPRRASRR